MAVNQLRGKDPQGYLRWLSDITKIFSITFLKCQCQIKAVSKQQQLANSFHTLPNYLGRGTYSNTINKWLQSTWNRTDNHPQRDGADTLKKCKGTFAGLRI
jgi:hypothetical protein